jgi:hypothetical protein
MWGGGGRGLKNTKEPNSFCCVHRKMGIRSTEKSSKSILKGMSHEIFRPVLACMDASRSEWESLLVLKLLCCSFDFWQLFSVLVQFIPILLGDSMNLSEGLTTEFVVLKFSFFLG